MLGSNSQRSGKDIPQEEFVPITERLIITQLSDNKRSMFLRAARCHQIEGTALADVPYRYLQRRLARSVFGRKAMKPAKTVFGTTAMLPSHDTPGLAQSLALLCFSLTLRD